MHPAYHNTVTFKCENLFIIIIIWQWFVWLHRSNPYDIQLSTPFGHNTLMFGRSIETQTRTFKP